MIYLLVLLLVALVSLAFGVNTGAKLAEAKASEESAASAERKARKDTELRRLKGQCRELQKQIDIANASPSPIVVRWEHISNPDVPGAAPTIYPDCTDIYLHATRVTAKVPEKPIELEVRVLRPDGSIAQRRRMEATGANTAEARLGGGAIGSMRAESGDCYLRLFNAATGKPLSKCRVQVLDLSSALKKHSATLSVSTEGSGAIKFYRTTGTARFDVTLHWNERVPRSKYQQIAVGLMAAHIETGTLFPIYTWLLTPEKRTWSFSLDYPIAGLGPGNWAFALQIGDTLLAKAELLLQTLEQAFAQIQLVKVQLKVKNKEGGDTFLEGSRVQLSQYRAVSPVVSLQIPCTVPEHKLTVRTVVCRDGLPLLGSAGEVPAKEGVSDVSFVQFALPEDRGNGKCLPYEIAVFVEGRFVKSWPFEAVSDEEAGPSRAPARRSTAARSGKSTATGKVAGSRRGKK